VSKYFFTILILFIQSQSFASKARVTSLQGADHLIDLQTTFINPVHLNYLLPFITYEMGAAGNGAEGGFSQKLSDGRNLAFYLGHNNTTDLRGTSTYLDQQNPIEVIYGMGDKAFSASFSTVDNKKSGTKETTLIGKYGTSTLDSQFYAHLHLISNATKTGTPDQKLNAAPVIVIGGSKDLGANRIFGGLNYGSARTESGSTSTDYKDTALSVGCENRSLKKQDADIYYGAQLNYFSRDIEGKKIVNTSLPVFLGMELNMNTWAVFRGSVSQNFILGSTKDETATNTDPDGINSNTTFAGGLGLKYNNLILDGSLAASTSGQVNGASFLTSAAVTYNY
jgi:hypothetical protein